MSHHHASGFSFCFALLLYMEVQITPDFLFPHDMFVFQQDPDSYLNVLQRPRVFGILPEGLADIWAVPETVVLSFFCGFRGEGRGVLSSDVFDPGFLYLFISNSLLGQNVLLLLMILQSTAV